MTSDPQCQMSIKVKAALGQELVGFFFHPFEVWEDVSTGAEAAFMDALRGAA